MLPTSPYYIGERSNIKRWGYLHRHAPMATEVTSKGEVTYIAILYGDRGNIKKWCYLHRHRRYVHRHAAMAREVTSKCEVTYIAILHGDRGNIKKRGYLHRHWCYLHRQAPMAREVISKCEVTYIAMLPGDRGNIRPYLCRQGATRELIPFSFDVRTSTRESRDVNLDGGKTTYSCTINCSQNQTTFIDIFFIIHRNYSKSNRTTIMAEIGFSTFSTM